jgi:hypothetical protein
MAAKRAQKSPALQGFVKFKGAVLNSAQGVNQ